MSGEKKDLSFAALFMAGDGAEERVMYVSNPPPEWLDGENMRELAVSVSGVYCLYFLIFSKSGGSAHLTVNGRRIYGSTATEDGGEICGSAVCSIRERALPCVLGVSVSDECDCGVLLIIRYDV